MVNQTVKWSVGEETQLAMGDNLKIKREERETYTRRRAGMNEDVEGKIKRSPAFMHPVGLAWEQ